MFIQEGVKIRISLFPNILIFGILFVTLATVY